MGLELYELENPSLHPHYCFPVSLCAMCVEGPEHVINDGQPWT